MRQPMYAFLAPVWAWILCACCVSPAAPEDLLAVGVRTPEQTFRTFQTAVRSELLGLEYRCLSPGFKERNGGVTELGWRIFREDLPWLKYAARAQVLERQDLRDGRIRLVARIDTLFVDETFAVDFVRLDFYETYEGEGLAEDGYAAWASIARREGDSLVLEVPMPQGYDLTELVELRAGTEWKIDAVERVNATP